MVVIRESPSAKLSPSKNPAQWPPQSPFQALMSSPSGRKRWTDKRARDRDRSTSPSPRKANPQSAKILRALSQASEEQDSPDPEDDDEEDEETVQLRLAEIQAKLKLKKLQQQRSRQALKADGKENAGTSKREDRPVRIAKAEPSRTIEVPLSPVREKLATNVQRSPARARLGLDGPARAADVSLKRPKAVGTRERREKASGTRPDEQPQRTSFSARLAASRSDAQDKQSKQERIERTRTTGFQTARPDVRTPSLPPRDGQHQSSKRLRSPLRTTNRQETEERPPSSKEQTSQTSFEAYSELHLTKRNIPHVDIAREMENREIYTLPRLLKEVKAPHYDPPDCENDFVVFGILASKTTPYDQKAAHRTSDENAPQDDASAPRNKFMVLKLCDLKWEVDCFLFGTAFDQFWKLTPGTLLAILNPGIMPPKTNQHSGRFSLKLGSSEDCVMEIGLARDLGYCASVKADGKQCDQWIDKRSTDICEYHLNLLVDKQRKGRMEVNNVTHAKGDSGSRLNSKNFGERGWDKKEKAPKNGQAHGEYGRLYAVPRGSGKSIATLLDDEDKGAILGEEASRKRIAAAQKERDLARRLCQMGKGIGAEYLRSTTGHSLKDGTQNNDRSNGLDEMFAKPKASELGLLDNKARDIHLSPAKDRRKHFGLGFDNAATTAGGSKAMGWGGAKTAGLLQPKQKPIVAPEKGQTTLSAAAHQRSSLVRDRSREGSLSPKKRARFALEKGIREPGRESMSKTYDANDDDDDDDLDIV